VYYFSRVIPSDLQHHYSKPRIIQSLKTKSAHKAAVASKILSAKLDDYWLGLRLKQVDVPASHLLISGATVNLESNLPTIDEALETYLTVKGAGKSDLFFTHTRRSSVLNIKGAGLHADAAIFDEAFIKHRSRVIGLAIAARKARFPDEQPYVYAPMANDNDQPIWNNEAVASLKDYNVTDLSI
jgi:hypothetical protein